MEIKAIQRLVQEFAEASIQADLMVFSNGRLARKYANKQIQCWRKIKKVGVLAKEELAHLLVHQDPSVRVAAAGYLLKYSTDAALAVLREAAQHKGIVAFTAQQCLKRWEEGEWHLDDD